MRIEKLKNITTKIGSGATPRGGQNSYSNQGISLIRSQNVLDFDFTTNGLAFINEEQAKELASVTVYENDILLNITGDSIARCCIVPKEILPARVNQHVAIIRCDDTVNSKYVFYYLQYLKPYLLKICGVGGTRNALTKEVIEELEIVIPSNQDDIAEILSSIDNKIQLNKKINTELENLAKTIYNYWFVQFDFPNEEGKPYKTSGGEMEWNEELKREIPKGWKVNLISKHFDYLEGPGITKDKYTTIGHKFINIKCIVDNDLDITEASMIKQDFIEQYSHFLLEENDIVVSTSGTLGRSAIVRKSHLPLLLNTSVIRFRPKNEDAFCFLYCYLKSERFLKTLRKEATGSIQKNFGPTHLDEMKDAFPSNNLIRQFEEIISPIIKKTLLLKEQNTELTKHRDFLLPLLMNGQVKVKSEAKEQLSMAAGPQLKYGK